VTMESLKSLRAPGNGMVRMLCGAENMPVFEGRDFGHCFEQVVLLTFLPISILLLSIFVFTIRYARSARAAKLRRLGYMPFEPTKYKESPDLLAIKYRNIRLLTIGQVLFTVAQVALSAVAVSQTGASRPKVISSLFRLGVWV
jgi:hypothetical protein